MIPTDESKKNEHLEQQLIWITLQLHSSLLRVEQNRLWNFKSLETDFHLPGD